ncbi:MAG: hypothetical protein AAF533_19305 [Acidobacteriota bacterium]
MTNDTSHAHRRPHGSLLLAGLVLLLTGTAEADGWSTDFSADATGPVAEPFTSMMAVGIHFYDTSGDELMVGDFGEASDGVGLRVDGDDSSRLKLELDEPKTVVVLDFGGDDPDKVPEGSVAKLQGKFGSFWVDVASVSLNRNGKMDQRLTASGTATDKYRFFFELNGTALPVAEIVDNVTVGDTVPMDQFWGYSVDELSDDAIAVLNQVIQSDAVQDATFKVTSDCEDSTLNDIELCDAAKVSDTYDDTDNATWDDICTGTCDAAKVSCDAVCESCKVACCYGCIWGKTCSCSSTCKCSEVRDDCYDGCVSFAEAGYSIEIRSVKGLGDLTVTDVTDLAVGGNLNDWSSTILTMKADAKATKVKTTFHYRVYDGAIVLEDTLSYTVGEASGAGQLVLQADCERDAIYAQLTSFSLYDVEWIDDSWIPDIYGMSYIEDGIDELNELLNSALGGSLSSELLDVLNDVLEDTPILPVSCP